MKNLFLAIQTLLLSKITAVTYIRMWNNQVRYLTDPDKDKDESFSLPCLLIEFVSSSDGIQQLGNGVQTYDPLYIKVHIIHDFYDAQDGTMGQNLAVLDMAELVYTSIQEWMPNNVPVGSMIRTGEEWDYDHGNIYHLIQTYKTTLIDSAMNKPLNGTLSVPVLGFIITPGQIAAFASEDFNFIYTNEDGTQIYVPEN